MIALHVMTMMLLSLFSLLFSSTTAARITQNSALAFSPAFRHVTARASSLKSNSWIQARRSRKVVDDSNVDDEDSTTTATSAFSNKRTPAASTSTSPARALDPAKKTALDGVLHLIEKNYGRGSIVKLGDADHMVLADGIPSGAITLDMALGGRGYPKGRVVEIYGPESSGKTTLALHAIAEIQKQGGVAAFIDAEHALDPQYASNLGVDINALLVSQPDSGEMALDVVDQLVRSSAVDVIVVDSVAALVPRAELEGDMSDMQIGLQARLMSKALRKITGSLPLSQCTVIFLNQLRSKIGVMYGSPEVTAGGNALKYYASVRMDTRRKEILPDNSGIRIKVKVVKNKVAAPFKSVTLDVLFGSGLDHVGCLLDAALDLGIVDRKGSWYAYQGRNLAQGRAAVIDLLKQPSSGDELDLAQQMERDVRQTLSSNDSAVGGQADATTTATTSTMMTMEQQDEEAQVEEMEESYMEA